MTPEIYTVPWFPDLAVGGRRAEVPGKAVICMFIVAAAVPHAPERWHEDAVVDAIAMVTGLPAVVVFGSLRMARVLGLVRTN